ncbi:MAG: type II toxin-antitoxin system RelB/DinJ family antitoxin [Patescibacteria group bacterium]|jgi:DNA-damage-inducible protein J
MATTTMSIKIDAQVKQSAQQIAADLGLSLSGVVNGFLKQFVRTKAVHFSLEEKEIPSPYLIKALRESQEDIAAGRVSPAFDNAEDAIKWLHTPESEQKYANQL